MGKAIKKAIGSVTSVVTDPLKKALLPDVPTPEAAPQAAPEAPDVTKDLADDDIEGVTESDKKKVKRVGKKSLSVSRSSGGGISI